MPIISFRHLCEDLAIAGVLHDVGLAEVSKAILLKVEEERTSEEKLIYERHPQNAIDIVTARKMLVSETVKKIILQHHERFSGMGYPNGLAGPKILLAAQIFGIANEVDSWISVKDGHLRRTPSDALRLLTRQCIDNATLAPFDPALMKKICGLFEIDFDLYQNKETA